MRNSLAAVGYWRGLQWVDKNVTLRHRPTGVVWTSLSPMELESQALHLDAMRGEVVFGGLGMGALAYSALQKPEVTRVTVVERDHEIVDALYHFASLSKWKNVAKLNVVFADVLCYRHPRPVDVLAVASVASVASGGRSLDLELGAPGARFYGSPPPIRLRRMVQAALPVGHRSPCASGPHPCARRGGAPARQGELNLPTPRAANAPRRGVPGRRRGSGVLGQPRLRRRPLGSPPRGVRCIGGPGGGAGGGAARRSLPGVRKRPRRRRNRGAHGPGRLAASVARSGQRRGRDPHTERGRTPSAPELVARHRHRFGISRATAYRAVRRTG